ncbi:cilia- and flagella-associated protein 57 isoform X1 [Nothobranchius furzeri]|uniref:Cilia and flagella associated protein 57 n=1 Tax=Nothobranchius furzeri TaxID=105023 RepID=A0A1A8UD32_NOTFU|nr:cilia and flagella associated protein 57 [Nothobranchius furzeri]
MASVRSQPHFIFGVRTRVTNNLCFVDEQTVAYPSGNCCVCHNTAVRRQRFIYGSDKSQGIRALAISPNRCYLAVSERAEKATITVFDLQHERGRRRKPLTAGDMLVSEFLCVAFSPDSKYLIGQSGGPEWTLVLWFWEKNKVLATVKSTSFNDPITQISFNPHNNMQLCVSGSGVFKVFRYYEGALKQSSIAKVESINILCHAWVSEKVFAGTDTGRLLVFESGDMRRELRMSSHSDRQVEMKWIKEIDVNGGLAASGITAILSYSKGFVCSTGPGTVCLFERTEDNVYRKYREIRIPSDPRSNDLNPAEIHTVCMSPAEETLAVSTDRGQLYSASLSSTDISRLLERHQCFESLSQPFHSSAITGLSTCILKPLVATCSLDRSVRIWNYETKELELYREFQEEAYSVALHPTGLFVLVGFSDKLRLMNLVLDDIRTLKEFTLRSCRECAFSHGGHMFAAVNGNVIYVYTFTTFENTLTLKAHNGKVRSVGWSLDDSRLVSCGMDGAVYEWNTHTGKRESESVVKSCSYTDVAFSWDYKTILAVGSDIVREIQSCQVLREVPADEGSLTALAVSHSGRVIFTGTSSGTIRAIKYPLPIQSEWVIQQPHGGPVNKMAITYDDQFLLTVSEDGCLLISKIVDKDGRGLKSNRQVVHTEEILVTKADLEEKAQHMLELKMHLEELQMENEYQLRLKDMSHTEKFRELMEKFTLEVESLKAAKKIMKTKIEEQECEHQKDSVEAAVKHSKQLQDLEQSYTSKLMVNHQKYQDLLQKHEQMQDEYKKQLTSAEESHTLALEDLTQVYKVKLQEKTQLLVQHQKEAEQKVHEFEKILKQAKEDEKEKIRLIQAQFEQQLHSEKETNEDLKKRAAVMAQKLHGAQRQADGWCDDVTKLKQEQQRLLGLIRSLEGDITEQKRQLSGHEKAGLDKDNTISSLVKKNQELETLKFLLEFQVNDFQKQMESQQDEINKTREKIQQLEDILLQKDKSNSQLKLSVSDLRLKLKTKDKEMRREMQKGKNLETFLERLKSDLHGCVGFIQDPKQLRDSILKMYSHYGPQLDHVEKSGAAQHVPEVFLHHQDLQEKTISSLKQKLEKSAKEREKVSAQMTKENEMLITEINALRKELHVVRTQLVHMKRSRTRPDQDTPREEVKHQEVR